ncbi:MAG: hypothetical protein U0003_02770 [Vampirovibrionales bacterium]
MTPTQEKPNATRPALSVAERDNTLNPRQLRAAGMIPATIYGKGQASQSIQVDNHTFVQHLSKGVRQFELEGLGGKAMPVKVQNVQVNPVSQQVLNAELLLLN